MLHRQRVPDDYDECDQRGNYACDNGDPFHGFPSDRHLAASRFNPLLIARSSLGVALASADTSRGVSRTDVSLIASAPCSVSNTLVRRRVPSPLATYPSA